MPPRVAIRAALPEDYAAYARLFAELGVPDPTPTPASFKAARAQMIVAVAGGPGGADGAGGTVVGYASWRLYGRLMHVVNVVTAPEARGRGVGGALMEALRAIGVDAGATRWYLNVKRDNGAAIRLYARAGLVAECDAWALDATWSLVARLPQGPPTRVVAIGPDDDARLAALGVVPDHVRFLRQRGRLALGLEATAGAASGDARGGLVALAAFDPAYPGAYPVAATTPLHLRALFLALQPHAEPERGDHVHVAIDRDAALADALLAAGATLRFALVRMHGPLARAASAPEAPVT